MTKVTCVSYHVSRNSWRKMTGVVVSQTPELVGALFIQIDMGPSFRSERVAVVKRRGRAT